MKRPFLYLFLGLLSVGLPLHAAPVPLSPSAQGTLNSGGGRQASPSHQNSSAIGGHGGLHMSSSGRVLAYSGALRSRVWQSSADRDADGLADELDPDNDNDGLSDRQELLAGTHPNDSDSQLRITTIALTDDGRIALKWTGHSDWRYRIRIIDGISGSAKQSLRLAPTQRLDGPLNTSTYVFEDLHHQNDARFYRVEIEEK